jgi:hypothetical protein
LVEISYPYKGFEKPRAARLFALNELDAAADFALSINAQSGKNVYVGATLRKPNAPRNRRANDSNFYAAPTLYADIDEDGFNAAIEVCEAIGEPPTCTVITGEAPYKRGHLLWSVDEPITDPVLYREITTALSRRLNGDRTIANPSRLFRLAGSLAWPIKDGRILELTRLESQKNEFCPVDIIAAAFKTEKSSKPLVLPNDIKSAARGTQQDIVEGGHNTNRLSIDACLEQILAGIEWHNNVLRVVGSMISRGLTDAEILTWAQIFALAGYSVEDTERDIQQMITSAREKWNIQSPKVILDPTSVSEPSRYFNAPQWLDRQIAKPDFLLGELYSTTSRVMTVGPTGKGKTSLSLAKAIAMAGGKDFLHWKCHRASRILYIDGEMPRDSMQERIGDAARRLGSVPENLVVLSLADNPDFVPLNMIEGQVWMDRTIDEINPEFIFFDNIQSLIVGDMKDEESWTATLPWIKRLTHRSIGQEWIHHTGHDESRSYGTKTREWQLDTVCTLKAVEHAAAFISFELTFPKARNRKQANMADFDNVRIVLLEDAWTSERIGHAPTAARKSSAATIRCENAVSAFRAALDQTPSASLSISEFDALMVSAGVIGRETNRGRFTDLRNRLVRRGDILIVKERITAPVTLPLRKSQE